MMLFINGISRGIQVTNLAYWVKNHESAFEILTGLVADKWMLEDATIVDGYDRMAVPIEAFDGQPIQVHIQALQKQWQYILSKQPLPSLNADRQQLIGWYKRLDAYYKDQITHLQKMMILLKLRQTKLAPMRNDHLKLRYDQQQNQLLESTQRMYKQTKLNRQKNRRRLNELEK